MAATIARNSRKILFFLKKCVINKRIPFYGPFCHPNYHGIICYSTIYREKLTVKKIINLKPFHKNIVVEGWIRAVRKHKEIIFLDIDDGSSMERLQVILSPGNKFCATDINYGEAVRIQGILERSTSKGQEIELKAETLMVLGSCKVEDYPFNPRTKHSVEYVRQYLHLRPRTRDFSSLLRTRNAATRAIHQYFENHNYIQIHTPAITSNDCEGAGEVFSIQPVFQNLKNSSNTSSKDASQNSVDFPNPDCFFDIPVYLTVSAQLHLEAAALALSNVYTFSPAFRAENSQSRRHLSEFYMVEAEKAFVTSVEDIMEVVEELVKYTTRCILEWCSEELRVFNGETNSSQVMKIEKMLEKPFIRMTYSEACEVFQSKKDLIQGYFKWGEDLRNEHEQCLLKHCGETPVFVTNFPADIKPFYMKRSHTGTTVECFDLLMPTGGEVCGGSLREDDEMVLKVRLKKAGLEDSLKWYLDLRRFGSAPLGGFGLGFERYLQYLLGINNIKDTIPFPRWPHHCQL
ncbi:probable asparagine--tRNA ligase, mitochondrial [Limulus polyphemus]|uniref:asparagine--tRNA ligase n=1 Tax=Limulus polyphemus TaxID=6850 RepID=A0ABM1BNI6_LIMPO|nr:probable asparagine--tRNA ligase, mitochondrial [Limulus polyphemus]